MTFWRNLTLYR